jgi:hypothetical protein
MTATEAFESVTHGGASDFADAVAILRDCGPWCLIGGLAVNCHVEPVYTLDADIVVVAEALPALNAGLVAAGFRVTEFPHSLNARRGAGRLSIQFTTDARYQDFVARAESREVLGVSVPVAALADLVAGKVWAWQDSTRRVTKRKKDELDLLRIAEAHESVRSLIPAAILNQLD